MQREAFTWLSITEFKRLRPLEKQAYLREVVAHLADQLLDESRAKAKPRRGRAGIRARS